MTKPHASSGTVLSQSRRDFLKTTCFTASGLVLGAPVLLRGQNLNSKLDIAAIGAGGKGESDISDCASENIVALCDIDHKRCAKSIQRFPNAKLYTDYRKMLDEMGKSIDAVTVSTPDHHHAPAAAMAMKMGKHAYVQKPLTHSVGEARFLRELAKKKKVATHMGNQGSANEGLRRAVEVIQAGVIGKPLELHVWSNRPIWPQGIDRPAGSDPLPENFDWDLFIGPAPMRPYKKDAYHPFSWRGWIDFGTGALGDMACHTVNMPFRALKLGYPTSIEAESTGTNNETWPKSSRIRFEFPARDGWPPLTFWWYDGKPDAADTFRPTKDQATDIIAKQGKLPGSGCLIVGDKGRLFSPDDYGSQFFMRLNDEKELVKDHEATKGVPQSIPRSPGHAKEWLLACKGGAPAYSNFDIAAYLTEIILLGCVALRAGRKIEWDGPKLKAKNMNVSHLVEREYRKGWKL
jgi:hypothetical protein